MPSAVSAVNTVVKLCTAVRFLRLRRSVRRECQLQNVTSRVHILLRMSGHIGKELSDHATLLKSC